MITLTLTEEEAKLLKQILLNAPISGNMKSLTEIMLVLTSILSRLDAPAGTPSEPAV